MKKLDETVMETFVDGINNIEISCTVGQLLDIVQGTFFKALRMLNDTGDEELQEIMTGVFSHLNADIMSNVMTEFCTDETNELVDRCMSEE